MTIVHSTEISTDPQDSLRSDLWDTMTVQELNNQHTLLMDRVSKVMLMMESTGTSQVVMDMYNVMQRALVTLSNLIETKSEGNYNA